MACSTLKLKCQLFWVAVRVQFPTWKIVFIIIPIARQGSTSLSLSTVQFKFQVLSVCTSPLGYLLPIPVNLGVPPIIFGRCYRKTRLPVGKSALIESPMTRTQQVLFPMQHIILLWSPPGIFLLLAGKWKLHHGVCFSDFGLNKKNSIDNFIHLF